MRAVLRIDCCASRRLDAAGRLRDTPWCKNLLRIRGLIATHHRLVFGAVVAGHLELCAADCVEKLLETCDLARIIAFTANDIRREKRCAINVLGNGNHRCSLRGHVAKTFDTTHVPIDAKRCP